MDPTNMLIVLLLGVAVFLLYPVVTVKGKTGDDRLSGRAEDQPKRPMPAKLSAAKARPKKKRVHE